MIKLFDNLYIRKLTIIIVWFSFFASINTNPAKIFSYEIINQLRLIAPFILCLIFFYLYRKTFKINFKYNISIFFYIIFISYTLFTFSTSLPFEPPFSVGIYSNSPINIFWPLIMFVTYLFLDKYCTENDLIMLFNLSIFIILLITIFFLLNTAYSMLERNYYHFYGYVRNVIVFAGSESPPKPTGIARMCLIIYSYLVLIYFLKKNHKNYFLLILITFFGLFTILYQSRTINFIFIISNFIFIIFYFKKFFFDKRLIFFCLLFPIILNMTYTNLIQGKYITAIGENNFGKLFQKSLIRDQKIWDINMSKKDRIIRFSSGRFSDWGKSIQVILRNPIKGYGAQSDREFLDGQSVHNSFLYAFLSGGILGAISIILIYIYSIKILLNFYFFKGKKDNHHYIMDICALIVSIILLRSLLETSFAVFGIDFLLFAVSILTLSRASYAKFK